MIDYEKTAFKGIIPFSGGIDSTAVAYKILKENPDDNFVLFKVNLINGTSGSRTILEEKAVDDLLILFDQDNIRNFAYRKIIFDYASLGPPPVWDSEIISFITSIIIQDKPEISTVYRGVIKDDYLQADFHDRLSKVADILYASSGRNSNDLAIKFPLKDMDKYQVMKFLPGRMLEKTWSCRYPEIGPPYTFVRCHKCPQCIVIDQLLKAHPDEFNDLDNLR